MKTFKPASQSENLAELFDRGIELRSSLRRFDLKRQLRLLHSRREGFDAGARRDSAQRAPINLHEYKNRIAQVNWSFAIRAGTALQNLFGRSCVIARLPQIAARAPETLGGRDGAALRGDPRGCRAPSAPAAAARLGPRNAFFALIQRAAKSVTNPSAVSRWV